MLFNSFHFFYFILIVLPVFYILPQKYRQFFLLLASYYFYMCWNYSYLVLITFTTATSYFAAIGIAHTENARLRKIYLYGSIAASLSILFFFKYYNLFADSINNISGSGFILLNYLLPVGISFYTFETLSYTIDVYKGKLVAERRFWVYALFISFFPKLVAGPIERSENLLPQFHRPHYLKASNIIQGGKYIITGYFMKLVIADRLGIYVDAVYEEADIHKGLTFWLVMICFSFQVLCDFAGYSAIARGVAKLLDIDLMLNFRRPHLALSFGEFWRRWHISLSTWFRDYVFIPLGGSRRGKIKTNINIFLTFVISGFWHGANWTFVIWGGLNGIYLIAENLITGRRKDNSGLSFVIKILRWAFVFLAISFGRVFFRSETIAKSIVIVRKMLYLEKGIFVDKNTLFYAVIGIAILMCMDLYTEKEGENNLLYNSALTIPVVLFFSFLVLTILFLGMFNGGQFIYFQF